MICGGFAANIFDSAIGVAPGTIFKNFQGVSWKMFIPKITGLSHIQTNIRNISPQLAKFKWENAITKAPQISCATISYLLSDVYELKKPLSVNLEIWENEVLAVIPELELYGEGQTETEALDDLETELIDLYEYLSPIPNGKLGKSPRAWKQTITSFFQMKRGN